MMTKLALLLTLAAGCSSSSTIDGPIDYTQSSGLAAIQTTLHIEPDGAVTYSKGSQPRIESTLDSAQLAEIYDQASAARFDSLAGSYACACADVPTYQLTVRVDDRPYTVNVAASAQVPAALDTFLRTLISLAADKE
ncbi:MAG TPA: hypothetical protein VGC42_19010 [Kofleriaceae bacterium]